jgi:hypothetical protein
MSADTLVALIILVVVFGAALLYGASRIYFWAAHSALDRREGVNPSPVSRRDYVTSAPPVRRTTPVTSVTSRQEAEAEVRREVKPEGDMGIVTITEKALQARLDDAEQQGMIAAFAVFQARGYIPRGKATELKEALFQVSGGRQLQALNAAIDAVAVPAAPEPAPSQLKPVTGNPRPQGVVYAGEQPELAEPSTA